ncbi:MAG: hypothetical protein K8T91_12040 [Planctomycetes bacterium]|nr:hypothetical protein [Planctomycetota bacterium]
MKTPNSKRRHFLTLLFVLGALLAIAGIIGLISIPAAIRSLDEEYKQVRAGQYRSKTIWFVPGGAPTVDYGYDGRDPKSDYEDKKSEYLAYEPLARRAILAGVAIAILSSIMLLSIDRASKPRTIEASHVD